MNKMYKNKEFIVYRNELEEKLDKLYEYPNKNFIERLFIDMNSEKPWIIYGKDLKLKNNIIITIYSPRLYLSLQIISLIIYLKANNAKLAFSEDTYNTYKLLNWIKKYYINVYNLLTN